MVLSNLLYVVGAIVAATVASGVVWLRHRRPKSLEAGIEMFSRELKALEPDRERERVADAGRTPTAYGSGAASPGERSTRRAAGTAGGGTATPGAAGAGRPATRPVRGGTVTPLPATVRTESPRGDRDVEDHGRDGAGASSPDREHDSG
jgi:hypothetical protein